MSSPNPAPDATLLIATHCPHCAAVLAALSELVKQGAIGQLTVVNLERHPERARAYGVRSVPWLRLGEFEFTGALSAGELKAWAERASSEAGWADYFHHLLKQGQAERAIEQLRAQPARLAAVLPIIANPEASLNVRIGAGMVLEEFAGQPALQALIGQLGELSRHADARVRADACHYLSLTGSPAARAYLEPRLDDPDAEVREIAQESLAALPPG